MIHPTVGRQVWYRPRVDELAHAHSQHFAATVTHVWSENCVNLQILRENGQPLCKTSVILAQDRMAQPGEAEWMPYQIGQAKAQEDKVAADYKHPLHAGIVPMNGLPG